MHNEERALWHTERAELYEKIAQLEASLRQYRPSSQTTSPVGKHRASSNSIFWSLLSTDGSRHTSSCDTGNEVWRGPKSSTGPLRTFSDSSEQLDKADGRLSSIAENAGIGSSEKAREIPMESPVKKPNIVGSQIDKSLDGINFKPSGLDPAVVKNIMTPQSPSPQSSSPTRISSGTIALPPPGLKAPIDQYTKDAGHTPRAPWSRFRSDGAGSAPSSGARTPTQPEMERPPLEPHHTVVKLPSERSDTYFPPSNDSITDTDPSLSGPLGLTNDSRGDKQFLSELDTRLLQAARSETNRASAVAGSSEENSADNSHVKDIEQPEEEPRLRIKRSMNFGSAFGAKHPGRGL